MCFWWGASMPPPKKGRLQPPMWTNKYTWFLAARCWAMVRDTSEGFRSLHHRCYSRRKGRTYVTTSSQVVAAECT
jgi:hypothetical protein